MKRMRMKQNGRVGSQPYKPKSSKLKALAPVDDAPALASDDRAAAAPEDQGAASASKRARVDVDVDLTTAAREFVATQGLDSINNLAELSEDELRGLTLDLAVDGFGWDCREAARLIAKINGLVVKAASPV